MTSTFFITDSFYLGPLSGTSLSAPQVAGAAALLLARYPNESYQQIINRVRYGTDTLPALAGKCSTGGRLNLRKALSPALQLTAIGGDVQTPFRLRVAAGPYRTCVVEMSTNFVTWIPVATNATQAAGVFEYADADATISPRRFYRVAAQP